MGPDLIRAMRLQAERFETDFLIGDATEVDFSGPVKKVVHYAGTAEAEAVIIATGAGANWLGLPSEKAFLGRGVSACATCDAPFFRGKKVAVVGGGDAAITEAIHLTHFAEKVTIIHRRQGFRAADILVERMKENEKIDTLLDCVLLEVLGDDAGPVSGLRLRNVTDDSETTHPFDGVFIAIGHSPATSVFQRQLDIDEKGYIKVHDGTLTSAAGVFAAGDVVDPLYKQAVLAAGMGCMAALDTERFLS
jgi:thioredoxin reductase (NADPH)